jgi:putative RecB family exonuclease
MTFTEPLPKSLSPSRLADFQACPRRYQYASVERIPQPATYATVKGRFVHYIFEQLYSVAGDDRTIERARQYVDAAIDVVLTDSVRRDIELTDELLARLLSETEAILVSYFEMEDPVAVHHEGVELRLGVEVDGVPLFGILDRLDRDDSGDLVIVDYKTGALPNRDYDTKTFANAELYAALCEAKLGERPAKIRLLYVAHGQSVERDVTEIVVRARASTAANAWARINDYYEDGAFPATPSKNTCRFCAYKVKCRASGVAVPG